MLRHLFQCFLSSKLNKSHKSTKLSNLCTDCLQLVIEKLPLVNRLQDAQTVSSQWAEIARSLCATQKQLTLYIRGGSQFKKTADKVTFCEQLINAVNPFHSLTVAGLTNEFTTFVTNTFPRLQTLAVVVNDQMTEDVNFLHCLPQLIAAYSSTLTTLELIWNVKDDTFQAIFNPLIVSIDSLHKLKRLSFFDTTKCLKVPLFDLPHLLSTSLETLDFYSGKSQNNLARHWKTSLQTRQSKKFKSLLKINYQAWARNESPLSFLIPTSVAAHMHSAFVNLQTVADLEHLTNDAFSNLKKLFLQCGLTLSVGDVLVRLARLPQLTHIYMQIENFNEVVYPANRPLPVLSASQRLYFSLPNQNLALHDRVNAEALRPKKVFPNVQQITLFTFTDRCTSCGWRIKVPDDGGSAQLVESTEQMMTKCVTRLATHFATGKTNSNLIVSFCKNDSTEITFSVYFDSEGQVKKVIKDIN